MPFWLIIIYLFLHNSKSQGRQLQSWFRSSTLWGLLNQFQWGSICCFSLMVARWLHQLQTACRHPTYSYQASKGGKGVSSFSGVPFILLGRKLFFQKTLTDFLWRFLGQRGVACLFLIIREAGKMSAWQFSLYVVWRALPAWRVCKSGRSVGSHHGCYCWQSTPLAWRWASWGSEMLSNIIQLVSDKAEIWVREFEF